MSFDEEIVAYFEYQDGCVKEGKAVIPPPESCSSAVQALYGLAQWHVATILIVAVFVGLMISLTMSALDRGGGH